ncbi:MAG TPA: RDD family protein [Bryobacteraceae bacterium]|nr:RDD family protein [Bryobacteraceae bacterium]
MTCTYCGFRNGEGEHRCRRCGRKPDDTLTGEFRWRTDGSLAAVAERAPRIQPPQPPAPNLSRAVQRNLFPERPASNVIPIESYAPIGADPIARPPDPAKPASRVQTRRPVPKVSEAQGRLDFLPALPATSRTLGTTVEAVIFCEAPVATPLHRAVAAAFDCVMVLCGYGLFLAAFFLAGGGFVATRHNLLMFGAALFLMAFTYGLFWTIAGTESAGMRWAGLRLTTFDGFPAEPRHRVLRLAGSCLSCCTLLGLLWSLADEESLTWQDHISRTFPTPLASDSQIFHRR